MKNLSLHLGCVGALVFSVVVLRLYPDAVLSLGYTCVLRTLVGWNCPFCGMTRDFVAMANGCSPLLNPFSAATASTIYIAYPGTVALCWLRREDVPGTPDTALRLLAPVLVAMFIGNNL
ncbi:MAG TPA: DUF2752 domain-containing protein [Bryobacteraceae bacterium]|nr:DUF2752 domain-containing protein [Bryobacteraceae bacterium]